MFTSVEDLSPSLQKQLRAMLGESGQRWVNRELAAAPTADEIVRPRPVEIGGARKRQVKALRKKAKPPLRSMPLKSVGPDDLIIDELPPPLNALWRSFAETGPDGLKQHWRRSKRYRNWTKWAKEFLLPQWLRPMLEGNVEVVIWFLVGDDRPPHREPDIDALQKILFDVLQGTCYESDRQITDKEVRKRRVVGYRSRLYVTVRQSTCNLVPPWA